MRGADSSSLFVSLTSAVSSDSVVTFATTSACGISACGISAFLSVLAMLFANTGSF